MRTQKRFTPALLQRFKRQERGIGTFQDYIPWHRVGRGDPASQGRSHLQMWKARQREMLSDGERDCLAFASMFKDIIDVREQHPLQQISSRHERLLYDISAGDHLFLGTVDIAKQLGFKHPTLTEGGISELWQMTTDQLLVLKAATAPLELIAIAYKPDNKNLTKRKRQLLEIEKTYWDIRGVTWLLITPETFDESVQLTLRRAAPWGLGTATTEDERAVAIHIAHRACWHTFNFLIHEIKNALGDLDLAQRAFWQAVWIGDICMDLRTGWRPHHPIKFLSPEAFRALNPISSRRSSWN